MKEKQINVVVVDVEGDPLLPFDESEPSAEFEQNRLDLAEDGCFEVLLAVGVFQTEEVEDIRIAENEIGRERVVVAESFEFLLDQLFGFFEIAVRSNSIDWMRSRSVRTLHRSTRHISA